jgi:transcriptional regulator with XRE-family HTH domain
MDRINEALLAIRNHLALSQEEAAERLKVSVATYQRWEWGQAQPQPLNRRKIRAEFGPILRELGLLPKEDATGEAATTAANGAAVQEAAPQDDSACSADEVAIPSPASSEDSPAQPEQPADGGIDEARHFIESHLTTHLWELAFRQYASAHEKRRAIQQAIKESDTMNSSDKNYQISRREALGALATLPMLTLGLSIPGKVVPPAQYGQAIAHCTASLEACWQLYYTGGATDTRLAFKSVSTYLDLLKTIVRTSPQYRREALDLATRYALLKTLLGWICVGPLATLPYAQEALALSKENGDLELQLSAYSKLAWGYFYNKQFPQALTTAQTGEALMLQHARLLNTAPLHPIVKAGTYSTLGLMLARNNKEPDSALERAAEIRPDHEPAAYAMMTSKPSTLLLEAGWAYCFAGNQVKAMEKLEQRVDPKTFEPLMPQSEMGRLETINVMAFSSLMTKDRDLGQTLHLATASITGAVAQQHMQRISEAATIQEYMEIAWPQEERVKQLRLLFPPVIPQP